MKKFNSSHYTEEDLKDDGFKKIGKNVRIADNATIVGAENISIGDNVRIDSYCTLVATHGEIVIGSYIHIAGYCYLSGGAGIEMQDFSGLSHGVKLYSMSDDYTGRHLTNPTVSEKYTRLTLGRVVLGRHVIVGANTVVLPGIVIGEGCAIGAMSLITKSLEPWGVYFGIPVTRIKDRKKNLLELEKQLLTEKQD